MKNNDGICWALNGMQYIMAIFTVENLQILQLILAIIMSAAIFAIKIIDWVKRARADKKISDKELDELETILKETYEEVKELKEHGGEKND